MMYAQRSKEVFRQEIQSLEEVALRIGIEMDNIVELLYNMKGKLVVTGIGKTGIIAHKIASSLASTGTPSFFMNAAEAMHGDLGMVRANDVLLIVSNSGSSQEILRIIPPIKQLKCPIIALTGNIQSPLAQEADYVLDASVEKEACPLGLAPTTSTTATLLMGDALVVCLIEKRNFKADDFALNHPGGALGKRLLVKVKDIMQRTIPRVKQSTPFKDVIYEISNKRLGMTIVTNAENAPIGIITDGDVRRAIQAHDDITKLTAFDFMTVGYKSITEDERIDDALRIMETNKITTLAVVENRSSHSIIGIIHIHDIFDYRK